ncbi:hypothetical protein D3C78_1216320 [compost metagenome]
MPNRLRITCSLSAATANRFPFGAGILPTILTKMLQAKLYSTSGRFKRYIFGNCYYMNIFSSAAGTLACLLNAFLYLLYSVL